jgi:WD40 repeat protein
MDIHNLLVTINGNGINLYSATTYDLVRSVTPPTLISSVAFSPDNTKLATTALLESLIIIWDVETITELASWSATSAKYSSIRFNHLGDKLITCHSQIGFNNWTCTITVWSMASHLAFTTVVIVKGWALVKFEICCCSKVIIKENGRLKFWDYDTDEKFEAAFEDEAIFTMSARSPVNNELAVGCRSGRIIIWGCETKQKVYDLYSAEMNREPCQALYLDRQGSRLFATTMGNKIKCWDVTSGSIVLVSVTLPDLVLWGVAVSPDGGTVLADGGGKVFICDESTGLLVTQKQNCSVWCFSENQQMVLM